MSITELFYAKQQARQARSFFRPKRHRKAHLRRRRFLLEPIEPRLLLSAATIATPQLLASLVTELGTIKDTLNTMFTDPNGDFAKDAKAEVPLLNVNNPNPSATEPLPAPTSPPKLIDFLGSGNLDFLTNFQNDLINVVSGFQTDSKSNTDFANYLNLADAGITGASVTQASYTDTGFVQTGGGLDANGNGTLFYKDTETTELDVALTFTLDQKIADKFILDLGKQADLLGFAINPSKNEGAKLNLEEKASFTFTFGTIDTQVTDRTDVWTNNHTTLSRTDTPEAPVFDPFMKTSGAAFDLSGNVLDTSNNVIDSSHKLGDFNLRLGFMQVTAKNGTISDNPDVHVAFTDPNGNDGFIKTGEATGFNVSEQNTSLTAHFDITGSFAGFNPSGSIDLSGNIFSFPPTASAMQPISGEFDPRTSPGISQTGLDDLLFFANISPDTALGLLEQLGGAPQAKAVLQDPNNPNSPQVPLKTPSGGWLTNFDGASSGGLLQFLDYNIPFAEGKTLGDVLNFAEAFNQKIYDTGITYNSTNKQFHFGTAGLVTGTQDSTSPSFITNFASVQELRDKLNALPGNILSQPAYNVLQNASYDTLNHVLTFEIKFDYQADNQSAPIDFNLALDGLQGVNLLPTSDKNVSLNNLMTHVHLTFGYDLTNPGGIELDAGLNKVSETVPNPADPTQNLTVTKLMPFTPNNGQLSSPADFFLDIGQVSTGNFKTIHVTVKPDNTNTNIDDLVKNIQDAINSVNTTGFTITVGQHPLIPGLLTITSPTADILRVRCDNSNPAATQLGFQNDPVRRFQTSEFFIQPGADIFKGDVTVTDGNLQVKANYGFLAITADGAGTVDETGHIAMSLSDPGTKIKDALGNTVGAQDGRIDLSELFASLQNASGNPDNVGVNLKQLVTSSSITGQGNDTATVDGSTVNNVAVTLNHLQSAPDFKDGTFDVNADLGGNAVIAIALPNFGDSTNLPVHAPDAIQDFTRINFTDVAGAIGGVAQFISNLELSTDFLNTTLPLTSITLKDVIDFVANLNSAVNNFTNNPAHSVQDLQQHLYQALGLPASSGAVVLDYAKHDALKITFDLTKGFSSTLPINFDLFNGALTLAGAAGLGASADATAKLVFGVSLTKAVEDLGFTGNQTATGIVIAPNGPLPTSTAIHTAFDLSVLKPGDTKPTTYSITLDSNNTSPSQLESDLQNALNAAGISGVTAGDVTVKDLGFDSGQNATGVLTATGAPLATGKLIETAFDLKVLSASNSKPTTYTVGLTSANPSLGQLETDLRNALNAAGVKGVTVRDDGKGHLQLAATVTDLGFNENQASAGGSLTAADIPTGTPINLVFDLTVDGVVHPAGVTSANTSLAQLASDLTNALANAGVRLKAVDDGNGHLKLETSVTDLGFTENLSGSGLLTAANAPLPFGTPINAGFILTVGSTDFKVGLATTNKDLKTLKADLQNALNNAGLVDSAGNAVINVGDNGSGHLTLTAATDTPSLKIASQQFAFSIASRKLEVDSIPTHLKLTADNPATQLTVRHQSFIYNDTGVGFEARVFGQTLNFTAAIGPVGLFVKGGTAVLDKDGDPNTNDPASFLVGLPNTKPRYSLAEVGGLSLSETLTGAVHAELPVYFPTTSSFLMDFDFQIADLNKPTDIQIKPDDMQSVLTALTGQFDNILEALPLTIDGLDTLLSGLQSVMNLKVFDPPLPLVGDKLTDAAQFIEDFRNNVVSQIRDTLDKAPALAAQAVKDAIWSVLGNQGGANVIEDHDNDGTVTEDDIVLAIDEKHIEYDMNLGQSYSRILPLGFDIGMPGLGLKVEGGIEVGIDWALPFDFGVNLDEGFYFVNPGTDAFTVKAHITPKGPDPNTAFTASGSLAFLSLQITDNDGRKDSQGNYLAEDHTKEEGFTGEFDVSLKGPNHLTFSTLGNLDVDATLSGGAYLDLDLLAGFGTQGVNTSFPTIEVKNFILDWSFTTADTASSLQDWGKDAGVRFDNIFFNIGSYVTDFLKPIFEKVDEIGEPIKPVLDVLTFPIPVLSQLQGSPVSLTTIAIDLGVAPPGLDTILTIVDKFIGIADDFVKLSATATGFGFSLGSIDFSSGNLNGGGGDLLTANSSADLVHYLESADNPLLPSSLVKFSSEAQKLAAAFDPNDPAKSTVALLKEATADLAGADSTITNVVGEVADFINSGLTYNKDSAGREKFTEFVWKFPLFEQPLSIMKLLLGQGQNIDLFTLQLPTFGFDFNYHQFFPIWGPLGVAIDGDVGAHINLGFGYDLSGLIQYANSDFRLDALHDIFYGFYVGTTRPVGTAPDATHQIYPLADFEAGIGAAAELNAVVASAGVEGKIQAEIDLFAHDPDGDARFHINEIITDLEIGYDVLKDLGAGSFLAGLGAPLALFDFKGELDLQFFAYIEALFGAWRKEFPLVDPITLLDFNFSLASYENPRLAEGDALNSTTSNPIEDGVLRLNIGPYAKNRVNGDTTDGNEEVYLRHISGTRGSETIAVYGPAFGIDAAHAQQFKNVKKIIIDAGAGNDHIVFDTDNGGILADVLVMGGVGDDTIDLRGAHGYATVHGGAGNDVIMGGDADGEMIFGEDGSDTITGGPGPDTIIGGLGDDSIDGGGGKDVILGDDGTADSGSSLGFINNQTANGTLNASGLPVLAGTPIDTTFNLIVGANIPANTFLVHVKSDNPSLSQLESDLSVALGAAGVTGVTVGDDGSGHLKLTDAGTQLTISLAVSLTGGNGNDTLTGGEGDDLVYGGDGNDYILGDEGSITVDGKGKVTGVTLSGGSGKDTIFGGTGDDFVHGGAGNDLIYGEKGIDKLFGDDDNDTIFGGLDKDAIIGGKGNDILFGDDGKVAVDNNGKVTSYTLLGGNGNDVILGDDGDIDLSQGLIPLVTLTGGTGGDDTAYGGDGADIIYGEEGNDSLLGNRDDDTVYGNAGNDYIDGGTGNDVLFGDNGQVQYVPQSAVPAPGLIALYYLKINTTDPTVIGNDKIHGSAGDDFIFAGPNDPNSGVGQDQVTGDEGNDIIFGDMGELDFGWSLQTGSLLHTAKTTDFGTGGVDQLSGGADSDLIFGGAAGDTISGDHDLSDKVVNHPGNDIIIGDQGQVDYAGGIIKKIATIDQANTDGGVDTINGNEGSDIILGGVAGDNLKGDGNDIMLGDEGFLRYDVAPNENLMINSALKPAAVGDTDPDLGFGSSQTATGTLTATGSPLTAGTPLKTAFDLTVGATTYAVGVSSANTDLSKLEDDLTGSLTAAGVTGVTVGDDGSGHLTLTSAQQLTIVPYNLATLDLVQSVPKAGGNILGDADTISGGPGIDIEMGGVEGDTMYGDGATLSSTASTVTQLGFSEDQTATGTLTAPTAVVIGTQQNPNPINTSFDLTVGPTTYAVSLISANDSDLKGLEDDLTAALNLAGVTGLTVGDSNGKLTLTAKDVSQQLTIATEVDQGDILLGDNGVVFLAGGYTGTLTFQGSAVVKIQTTDDTENTGGADTISGNAGADIIFGGVNNGGVDKLYGDRLDPTTDSIGRDGGDVLLGDNGLLDFNSANIDKNVPFTLTLIHSSLDALGGKDVISGNAGRDVGIGGTGGDEIYGDADTVARLAGSQDGDDILLGDNADVFLNPPQGVPGEVLVLNKAVVKIVTTDTDNSTGGIDTISGNAGNDMIAGGVFGDTLYGDRAAPTAQTTIDDGNDIILGDNARFEWLSDFDKSKVPSLATDNPGLNNATTDTNQGSLDLVTTQDPNLGGRDTIYGDAGKDVVFGGTDSDLIYGDDGTLDEVASTNNDLLFGDHGRLYPQFSFRPDFPSHNFFSIDTGDGDGGQGDRIYGEEGDDVLIGGQGDDRMYGGAGNDDMIGGHNVPGGIDELGAGAINATVGSAPINDMMDGGSGDDAMAGDNATIWRKADLTDPRIRALTGTLMYQAFPSTALPETNSNYGSPAVTADVQIDPNGAVGRVITLLNHDIATQALTGARPFGNDYMAGGVNSFKTADPAHPYGGDLMFGELGDDVMQGDGAIVTTSLQGVASQTIGVTDTPSHSTDQTLYFNVVENTADGNDYMEGNGGADLMYGGLGQDDMIGGSSNLFGLDTPDKRPDVGDTIFGGAGGRVARNYDTTGDSLIPADQLHARDSDMILGDNGNVYRLVGTNGTSTGNFLSFDYDTNGGTGTGFYAGYGTLKIIPRVPQQLDYVQGDASTNYGDTKTNNVTHGFGDVIHGEAGDDFIRGMIGHDVIYGESQDDDVYGGAGNDWISGGTGDDGVLGDDGLIFSSRNSSAYGEPLYGIAALHPQQTNITPSTVIDTLAINAPITTPGNIQQSIINVDTELKKTFDLVPLPFDAPNTLSAHTTDDIIYGGLGDDSLHGGTGDDALSGAEALPLSAGNQGGARLVLFSYANPYPAHDVNLNYLVGANDYSPNTGNILGYDLGPGAKKDVNRRFLFYDGINADAREKIMLDTSGNRILTLSTAGTTPQYEYFLNFEAFTGDGVTTDGINYGVAGHTTKGDIWPTTDAEKLTEIQAIVNDGNDVIFGDNGNDWLVGGTSLDRLYGGSGDDLMNIDDNLETNQGLNDIPDGTYFKISGSKVPGADGSAFSGVNMDKRLAGKTIGADIAYGGAGLDVLMDNTGADRMIDWVGEFNSYITPYAPFGEFSVSRTVQPQLPEYLYALSASDGADPSRAFDAGSDPTRNGEPFGEMALVLQRDPQWHDQVGPPRDQQAGNLPGGHRDVMAANDFTNPIDPPFAPVSGTWSQVNGVYKGTSTVDGVSLFYDNVQLPSYYEVLANVSLGKPTAGVKANGYIVFDYYGPTDFKFAGINGSTMKLEIGARTASGWNVLTQSANMLFNSNTFYNLTLAVNGTRATLSVNGTNALSYTFAPRMINGVASNLNTGMVGLAVNNAVTTFDNMIVQKLSPVTVFQKTEDFSASAGMFGAQQGTWAVSGGRYTGTPGADAALSTVGLVVDPASLVLFQTLVNTGSAAGSMAGIVFDYYTPQDFKFAAISPATGQVIIGHRNAYGWFTDLAVKQTLTAGGDYTLGITLTGATVNVSLNGNDVATYTYDRYLNFGTVGLFSKGAKSSFDNVVLKGDDPSYVLKNTAQTLTAESAPTQATANLQPVSNTELTPIVQEAVSLWSHSLSISGTTGALEAISFQIADLPDNLLGEVIGDTVLIDTDADGYGWFVDATPDTNAEFGAVGPGGELVAAASSLAYGEMDLLTVVMHEIGHVLGYGDLDPATAPTDLMSATLEEGVRRLPGELEASPAPLVWDAVNGSLQALDNTKPLAGVTGFTVRAVPASGNGTPATPSPASTEHRAAIEWTGQYVAALARATPHDDGSIADPILPPVEVQLAPSAKGKR